MLDPVFEFHKGSRGVIISQAKTNLERVGWNVGNRFRLACSIDEGFASYLGFLIAAEKVHSAFSQIIPAPSQGLHFTRCFIRSCSSTSET